ncbi:MAG: hypothetical protein HYR60_32440 [Acidobacteria bacterium]|nr:hypothetical protein [Acidobacteriota bacterium]
MPVDAPVLAQPLVVQVLNFRGEQHSVLWVATATNNIYAFNADPPFQQLGPPIYLGPPYAPDPTELKKLGGGALLTYVEGPNGRYPIIGIESTPVIDGRRKMMFVGYRRNSGLTGQQRLAAIDMTTGVVKRDVAIPGSVTWHELHRNRASLLLDNNVLYIAFAAMNEGHRVGDYTKSYQGWVYAFDPSTLNPLGAYRTVHDPANSGDPLNDSLDGGGIWQGSTGLAADSKGNIFFATGNGAKKPAPPDAGGLNLSSSVVRLSVTRIAGTNRLSMTPADWFTPYRKLWQDPGDMDLGSAGVVLIPGTKYLVMAGKEGILYVLDQSNLGKFDNQPPVGFCPLPIPEGDDPGRDKVADKFRVGFNQYLGELPRCAGFDWQQWPHVHGTPVFGDFGGGKAFLYIWPEKDHLKSFHWLGGKFDHRPTIATARSSRKAVLAPPWKDSAEMERIRRFGQNGMPGAMLALSLDPTKPEAGVLFASVKTCGDDTGWKDCSIELCGSPRDHVCMDQDWGMLRAFDPISMRELWNNQEDTNATASDKRYGFAKFVPPTVTKGRVYLATASKKVLVYGSLGGVIWQYTGTPCSGDSCPGWRRLDDNDFTMGIAAAGNELYQLQYDGEIWRYTGPPCDAHAFCPGWQRLDNNRKAVAIAAGGAQLYQLHNDGSIWQSTGAACSGNSCPGWLRLDNNSKTVAIAAGDGSLYQLHNDGWIWQYTGTPCSANACPGWVRLDNNSKTVAIAAAGGSLYQLHNDGWVWQYTGAPCTGNACPGWLRLDRNSKTAAIAAGGGSLYQLHNDGWIWQYTGTPCTGDSCPGWLRLDHNSKTVAIAAAGGSLYQLHNDGWIWRYNGTACTGDSCPGWLRLDNNPRSGLIAAGGTQLYQLHADPVYQLHDNGSIWRNIGLGWYKLDDNRASKAIAAAGKELFQLHSDGSIWRFTGTPCNATSCPGWEKLDNNSETVGIAAAGKELFQLRRNGSLWRYTGTPCAASCPGWQQLDNNSTTVSMAAAGKELIQLRRDGSIWRFTGAGWQQLGNNSATLTLATGGKELFQLHKTGAIWRYTGRPCANNSCPGWQQLDNNSGSASIVAAGKELFQQHKDGSIWRYMGRPCVNNSCPGWQKLDGNTGSAAIAAGGKELFQLHKDGSIWHYLGTPCTGACPGWRQLDNNASAKHVAAGSVQ